MSISKEVDQTEKDKVCTPHMLFAVNLDPCYILTVTVLEGRQISKGWIRDLMDTPDPYVILRIPDSPNGKKRTRHFDNTANPVWEETFNFVVDPGKLSVLEVTLMDANYTIDQVLGQASLELDAIPLDKDNVSTLKFGEVSEVVLKVLLSSNQEADLRYGLALCEKEKEFKRHRRKFVLSSLCKLLHEKGPQKESEVPTLGVLGSGGGFRAMTAFSGVFKALSNTGILDCTTYVAGLSGSAWYLSTLYSHPEFPSKSPGDLQEELKSSICHSPFWLLSPRSLYRYISTIKEKKKNGQPVSFTDFFGHLLGDTLLKGRTDSTLSGQQQKIEEGVMPFPLYTCLHVKSNVSARVFQDWFEFTPYEVGISKYATFMKTEVFGSKLYKGHIVMQYPEYPLHYLQGIWGSAFCILFKRLIQERTKLSLDLNPPPEVPDDEDDEIYFDAEEEFPQDEEDHIRCLFENLDIECEGKVESDDSDNEEQPAEPTNGSGSPSKLSRILTTGFWQEFVNNVCTSSAMNTRKGRAGLILNPLRGLSLIPCFSFSPFSPTSPNDDMMFKGLTEPVHTQSKTLYLVDGGLTFNLPFPLLLRPQRAVDIYLSFDFSSRDTDSSLPFKELLLSEKWARINGCLFPPIHELSMQFIKEPPKECYVFKHPSNDLCPIILHFPLVNKDFKDYKEPGIKRETPEEFEFANFNIFSDPKKRYSIYNFKYPHLQFERLSQLMEFNVLNNIDIIKENLSIVIERKKKMLSQTELILSENIRRGSKA